MNIWDKMLVHLTRSTHRIKRKQIISTILSNVIQNFLISNTSTSMKRYTLTNEELRQGCKAGLDTWADTCCVNKHVFVREVIEGKLASASGFANNLPTVQDIPIVNCSMAYDDDIGNTYILEVNNVLYLGENLKNILLCPNQCESNGVQIDLRPSQFYPQCDTASTIACDNNLVVPIKHDGPLPYFDVLHPTKNELHSCPKIELTSLDNWEPYSLNYNFSSAICAVDDSNKGFEYEECQVTNALMSVHHYEKIIAATDITYDFNTDTATTVNAFATT